jgi:hypothetical protein
MAVQVGIAVLAFKPLRFDGVLLTLELVVEFEAELLASHIDGYFRRGGTGARSSTFACFFNRSRLPRSHLSAKSCGLFGPSHCVKLISLFGIMD